MKRAKLSKAFCGGVTTAAIQHSLVESDRHLKDKKFATQKRREVRIKRTGNKLADRQRITERTRGVDRRLSDWANEHIGEPAGDAVKWSGWDVRFPKMPRPTLQQQMSTPQTPQGPAGGE